MTAPRPPQPQAEPGRRPEPGTPLLTAIAAAALVIALWVAALALLTPRGPQTCVRQFGERGELIQQWTTDTGAQTALTGWSFTVHGEPYKATGNLVEFPGACPLEAPR